MIDRSARFIQQGLPERLNLQDRKKGAHVSEGFVESCRLDGLSIEQLRPNGIKNPMAHFVACDIRALPREIHPPCDGFMKEVQAGGLSSAPPGVESVQIHA